MGEQTTSENKIWKRRVTSLLSRADADHWVPCLTGLRGLACLGIFGANYLNKIVPDWRLLDLDMANFLGRTGIVTLILLSGFGLSLSFWRAVSLGNKLPRLGRFWLKRIARIGPAYFLCLTILIVHNEHWNEAYGRVDILLHYTFLFNYTEFSFYSINPVFWVLATFAQFYLVLPFLFLFSGRNKPLLTLSIVCMVCVGSYVAHAAIMLYASSIYPWPYDPDLVRQYGSVLGRSLVAYLPHFLFGVVAGYIYSRGRSNDCPKARAFKGRLDVCFWSCVILLIVVLATPVAEFLQIPYGRYNLPYVPVLVMLLILCAPGGRLAHAVLESKSIKSVGIISYGVFVYHYPVINLTTRYIDNYGIDVKTNWFIVALIALVATVIVAAFSYRLVERPIMRFVRRRVVEGA